MAKPKIIQAVVCLMIRLLPMSNRFHINEYVTLLTVSYWVVEECLATYSRNTSSMRVCQPVPVARK